MEFRNERDFRNPFVCMPAVLDLVAQQGSPVSMWTPLGMKNLLLS